MFDKILNLLIINFGQIWCIERRQIMKNNLAILSHWSWRLPEEWVRRNIHQRLWTWIGSERTRFGFGFGVNLLKTFSFSGFEWPVWPDIGIKSSHRWFYLKMWIFQSSPKCYKIFGLLLQKKLDNLNFQKLPNLVTLEHSNLGRTFLKRKWNFWGRAQSDQMVRLFFNIVSFIILEI